MRAACVVSALIASAPVLTLAQARSAPSATAATVCTADRVAGSLTVAQALGRIRPVSPKGEFETTEAFRARAAAANPSLQADDAAVLLPIPPVLVRYDADKREFNLSSPNFGLFHASMAWVKGR